LGDKTKLDIIETYGQVSMMWEAERWTVRVRNNRGAGIMEMSPDKWQAITSLYLRLRRTVARDIQEHVEFTGTRG